jgi:hypothetical protein
MEGRKRATTHLNEQDWKQGRTAPQCKQFTTGTSTENATDLKKNSESLNKKRRWTQHTLSTELQENPTIEKHGIFALPSKQRGINKDVQTCTRRGATRHILDGSTDRNNNRLEKQN